jgi:hypothetical protein
VPLLLLTPFGVEPGVEPPVVLLAKGVADVPELEPVPVLSADVDVDVDVEEAP